MKHQVRKAGSVWGSGLALVLTGGLPLWLRRAYRICQTTFYRAQFSQDRIVIILASPGVAQNPAGLCGSSTSVEEGRAVL